MACPRKLTIASDRLENALAGKAFLLMDGGMGTLVQQAGLHQVHQNPDLLNLTHPADIQAIQHRYVEAGSDCITTNTFGSNRLKLEGTGATVTEVYAAAASIARAAGAPLVAGDIGPTGQLLEPMGTLAFEDAYDIFAEQARAAEAAGCDLIVVETMTDLREIKAAVLAAVENTSLPVFATMSFGEDGRTFLGTTPAIAAATLSALGAQVVGLNCSLGPDEIAPLARQMTPFSRCPLMAQPNAGLPRMVDGATVFDVSPEAFAQAMLPIIEAGITVVGGCCGTTPDHIRALRQLVDGQPSPVAARPGNAAPSFPNPRYCPAFTVTSAQEMVSLPEGEARIAVIGERINPTGKKKLKAALQAGDFDYLVGEAVAQQRADADILDVNVGVPGLDEPAVLARAVETLQATVPLPLQIDSSDPAAVEAACRRYTGRPMVNSVNGKRANLETVLPTVARYGCTVVGLTLDEDGIPSTAEGRLAIARRIVDAAASYGIPKEDVAIDCLVMAAATNQSEVREILRATALCKQELGVRTVLGVSNVSFGLPQRPMVNSVFLAAALGAGLDMPILNPLSPRYRDTVNTFRVLNGQDSGARAFLEVYAQASDPYDGPAGDGPANAAATTGAGASLSAATAAAPEAAAPSEQCPIAIPESFSADADAVHAMVDLVLSGRSTPMAAATESLLKRHDPIAIINDIFVPVLDVVGARYESGAFFLPQLMASAEAVKAGFDVIRERTAGERPTASDATATTAGANAAATATVAGASATDEATAAPNAIVLATVEGDIHDIGKNIVKMLLENYGFPIIDLGKDVAPETVLAAVQQSGARLVGLSALMTTTVGAMERTIRVVHEQCPHAAVMVGGAVVTQDFADSIGADFYAKDASESARIASTFFAK